MSAPPPSQYSIFIRLLVVSIVLLLSSTWLLVSFPSLPFLSWVPMLLFTWISYASFFPSGHRHVRSYLRLCSLVLTVSLFQTAVPLLLWWLLHLATGLSMQPWRFATLAPYIVATGIFVRRSPDLPLNSPRAYLVHFLYDPPALLVCYLYSAVLHDPLNSLFTHITPSLLLGSLPFPHDVPTLQAANVTAVVNMCREYPGPVSQYATFGIEQCWLPTADMGAPRLEDLESAVAFISQHLQSGSSSSSSAPKVLIHCKCGMSRSASVVVCYLVSAEKMTSATALQLVKQKRPEVSTDILDYPAVKQFIAQHLHPAVTTTAERQDKEKERIKEELSGLAEIGRTIKSRVVP